MSTDPLPQGHIRLTLWADPDWPLKLTGYRVPIGRRVAQAIKRLARAYGLEVVRMEGHIPEHQLEEPT